MKAVRGLRLSLKRVSEFTLNVRSPERIKVKSQRQFFINYLLSIMIILHIFYFVNSFLYYFIVTVWKMISYFYVLHFYYFH